VGIKLNPFTGQLDLTGSVSSSSGDVVGPASSTDNEVPRYNLATGKLLQGSNCTISDTRQFWAPNSTYTDSMALGLSNVISGARTYLFGSFCAAAQYSVMIGYSCSSTTQRSVSIGYTCTSNGGSAVSIGYTCAATGVSSIALGNGAQALTTGAIAIGNGATAQTNAYTFALGQASSATGAESIAIGKSATVSGTYSAAIGTGSSASGNFSFSFFGTASHANCCVIGFTSTTATNQLILGGYAGGAGGFNDVYIGYGVTNTTVNNLTINASGRSGANLTGVNMSIYSGKGTGTGEGGALYLGRSEAGSSGSSLNAVANYFSLESTGVIVNPSFKTTVDFFIRGTGSNVMSWYDSSASYLENKINSTHWLDDSSNPIMYLNTGGRVYVAAPSTAPTTGNMFNGSYTISVDEGTNIATFTFKYSDGTIKTFAGALV
jgi:hypothetical protein